MKKSKFLGKDVTSIRVGDLPNWRGYKNRGILLLSTEGEPSHIFFTISAFRNCLDKILEFRQKAETADILLGGKSDEAKREKEEYQEAQLEAPKKALIDILGGFKEFSNVLSRAKALRSMTSGVLSEKSNKTLNLALKTLDELVLAKGDFYQVKYAFHPGEMRRGVIRPSMTGKKYFKDFEQVSSFFEAVKRLAQGLV